MHILTQVIHRRLLEAAGNDGAQSGGAAGDSGSDAGGDAQRAEVEQRARDMGWSPKDQWRGNPGSWIDAQEFVQRGEQIMPILRNNLRSRDTEIAALKEQLRQANTGLQAANESIQVLTNLSTEQSRQAARDKRKALLREQAQARTDGDTDREIEIGEQIADVTSQINAAQAAADADGDAPPPTRRNGKKSTAASQPRGENPTADPEYQQWAGENPWFGTDHIKTAVATAVAQKLRSDPANASLQGKAFFDRVTAETNRALGNGSNQRPPSKVEGAAGSGDNGGGGGGTVNGKTYNDLPPEAKAACERDAKILVGDGKAFKTIADWRKHYVVAYFNS